MTHIRILSVFREFRRRENSTVAFENRENNPVRVRTLDEPTTLRRRRNFSLIKNRLSPADVVDKHADYHQSEISHGLVVGTKNSEKIHFCIVQYSHLKFIQASALLVVLYFKSSFIYINDSL